MSESRGFRGYKEGEGFHPLDSVDPKPSPFAMSGDEWAKKVKEMAEQTQAEKNQRIDDGNQQEFKKAA